MVAPQDAGFTGRVWEAVPADQLVRELTTGPGAGPMAAAGVAYEQLAAELTESTAEYRALVGALSVAWPSSSGDAVVQRISALTTWMDEATAAATANGGHAAVQAAAYQTAVLAMPAAADAAVLQALKDALAHGSPLGGPLVAVSATLEDRADSVTTMAAEVMRRYEAATAPLAEPWSQEHPPVLTTDAALLTQRAASNTLVGNGITATPGIGAWPVPSELAIPRMTPTDYRPQPSLVVGPSVHTGEVSTVNGAPAEPSVGSPMPPVSPGVVANSGDSEYEPVRPAAGLIEVGGPDHGGFDTGFAAAPPVLGGSATGARVIIAGTEDT